MRRASLQELHTHSYLSTSTPPMPTKTVFKGSTLRISRSPANSPLSSPRRFTPSSTTIPLPSPLASRNSTRLSVPYPSHRSQTSSPALSSFSILHTPSTSYLSIFAPAPSATSIYSSFAPSFETQNALGLIGIHVPPVMINVAHAFKTRMMDVERQLSPLDALIEEVCHGAVLDELSEEEFLDDSWVHSLLIARAGFKVLQETLGEIDRFSTDDTTLSDKLEELSDQIVSLQIAMDHFYRDAHTKWWPRVPEPPESIQIVSALVQCLYIKPIPGTLVAAIPDLSERMASDVKKLQGAANESATQTHELQFTAKEWGDGDVSFHVPRKIALLSKPYGDYDSFPISQLDPLSPEDVVRA
ncbi:uncharacterized protein EI90DRAFT_3035546 [Cantharellus anzutake]|uniref:uncharacterized protein n=1 Tax=Cantharellus anzutake TaxID=1750568 RepID=UPI001905CD33|nr:uncharacterized protein EI90DRAFT_3035546 [Cantharellus anzutake]KAF8340438.1 hypothetical protein EI90DRAFT_3035546 [Cantharellus anzutake]